MKKLLLSLSFLASLTSQATLAESSYSTPKAFMNLYFDFTGAHYSDYPKGKVNASETLINSQEANKKLDDGPLIIVMDTSIYIYDNNGKKLLDFPMRTNRKNGFFEMTAISHVGPAVAYYLKAKENGSTEWRAGLKTLLTDLKAVQELNAKKKDNWLDKVAAPSWKTFKTQIHNMVDYACSLAGNYVNNALATGEFTQQSLIKDFYNSSSKQYPIPYNNIMIATFMLTVLETLDELDQAITKINLDWPNAKVIIRNKVGTNVTAGLTSGNNWVYPTLIALSKQKLPEKRILIAPYTDLKKELGEDQLPSSTLSYYRDQIWGSIYNRTQIARQVFTFIPDVYVAGRPPLPGDYGITNADNTMDFMIRLKYSLANATQMLSDTVAFWMSGEFINKDGDITKMQVPGITTGFPKGINGYPANNPKVKA